MRRVAFVGTPGSGKTTLARRLAKREQLTHIELDALFHQPGWIPAPHEKFRANLEQLMDEADALTDGWTTCGNYTDAAAGLHISRADTIVWLDLPRIPTTRRVLFRTVRRGLRREELWNGNRERLASLLRVKPENNIVRWAWVKHPEYAAQYESASTDGTWSHATVIRLRSPKEIETFAT